MGRPPLTEREVPVGTRFGRWITVSAPYVVRDSVPSKSWVDVKCDCGIIAARRVGHLRQGQSQSCGCLISDRNRDWSGPKSPCWRGEKGSFAQKAQWLYQEKAGPCLDCGQRFPAKMMQFDHVPGRGSKSFCVGIDAARSRRSLAELKIERAKCDLVCPNCHWLRTLSRYDTGDLDGAGTKEEIRLKALRRRRKQDPSVIYPEPPEETTDA